MSESSNIERYQSGRLGHQVETRKPGYRIDGAHAGHLSKLRELCQGGFSDTSNRGHVLQAVLGHYLPQREVDQARIVAYQRHGQVDSPSVLSGEQALGRLDDFVNARVDGGLGGDTVGTDVHWKFCRAKECSIGRPARSCRAVAFRRDTYDAR